MTGARRVLLPPLPRRRDFALAGLSAGLLLGIFEVLGLRIGGAAVPPRLALALCAGAALLAGSVSVLVGSSLRLAGVRAGTGTLVGSALGALLLTAFAGAAPQLSGVRAAAGLVAALALSSGAALLVSRHLTRLERTGALPSGPALLALAAVAVAAGERVAAAPPNARLRPEWLVAAALSAAVCAVGVVRIARHRPTSTSPWGRLVFAVGAAAVGLAYGAQWSVWLEADRPAPLDARVPPNVLLIGFGPEGGPREPRLPEAEQPAAAPPEALAATQLALVASDGIHFERVRVASRTDAAGLLALRDGSSIVEHLAARGYQTAAILRDPERRPPRGVAEVDARPGSRVVLERSGRTTAAGSLLLALGSWAPAALGLDVRRRRPSEVAAAAVRWLVRWRTHRADTPFFLLVDLDAGSEGASEQARDAAVGHVLGWLDELGVGDRTLVLVASRRGRADAELGVRVRPPAPDTAHGVRVREPVAASSIGVALLALADGRSELRLPGVVGS